ncbi:MAG: hypothetical protein AAF092_02795 [Pseudomonadota bacterium]
MEITRERAMQNIKYGIGLMAFGAINSFIFIEYREFVLEHGLNIPLFVLGPLAMFWGFVRTSHFGTAPILKHAAGGSKLFNSFFFYPFVPALKDKDEEDGKDKKQPLK